jgi:hypothetical protein
MLTFLVKTHRWKRNYQAPHFYLQAKGLHAGRPLKEPLRNSFVVFADEQNLEALYWLCQALYETSRFQYLLKGSVIPFLTICDLKNELKNAANHQLKRPTSDIKKLAQALNQIEEQQTNLHLMIEKLELLKLTTAQNLLSEAI